MDEGISSPFSAKSLFNVFNIFGNPECGFFGGGGVDSRASMGINHFP